MSSGNKYLTPPRKIKSNSNSTSSRNIKSVTKNINNKNTNKEFIIGFKQLLKNIFNEEFNVPTSTKRSATKRPPPTRKNLEVVSNLKIFPPSPQLNSNIKKAKARRLVYNSKKNNFNFNSNNNNNVVQKVKRKK